MPQVKQTRFITQNFCSVVENLKELTPNNIPLFLSAETASANTLPCGLIYPTTYVKGNNNVCPIYLVALNIMPILY